MAAGRRSSWDCWCRALARLHSLHWSRPPDRRDAGRRTRRSPCRWSLRPGSAELVRVRVGVVIDLDRCRPGVAAVIRGDVVGWPLRVVIQLVAWVEPRGCTAAATTSAARLGLGSWGVPMLKLCEPSAL